MLRASCNLALSSRKTCGGDELSELDALDHLWGSGQPLQPSVKSLSSIVSSPMLRRAVDDSKIKRCQLPSERSNGDHLRMSSPELPPSSVPKSPASSSRHSSRVVRPYYRVRAAEILLPAWSSSNDANRIRNNGRPTLAHEDRSLQYSASAPSLPPVTSLSPRTSPRPAPKPVPWSRRTIPEGAVKTVSKVVMTYPEWNPLSLDGRKTSPRSNHTSIIVDRPRSPNVSVREKETTWADLPEPELDSHKHLSTESSIEMNSQSDLLKKQGKLLQNLHALRRVGALDAECNAAKEAAAKAPAKAAAEENDEDDDENALDAEDKRPSSPQDDGVGDDSLLIGALKDLDDTSSSLDMKRKAIADTCAMVELCGGKRHPTNLLSLRTLAIFNRKTELLTAVEERTAVFEAANARQDAIVHQMLDGLEPPEELRGIRKFISSYVHRPGDPVDADRSNFEAFVATFKLPSRHFSIEKLRGLTDEAGDSWAKRTSIEASKGASKEAIKQMITLSISAGADADHPMLVRATVVLNDRIANSLREEAVKLREKDEVAAKQAEGRGNVPEVGVATQYADSIEENIKIAIKQGVTPTDARVGDCKAIIKRLRELDGERKRMAAREKRLREEARKKKEQEG